MLKINLRSAWRSLWRNPLFSSINIFGLALGMAICIIVLTHLRDQLSYDDFHPNKDRMARIITDLTGKDGRQFRLATSPLPFADAARKNFEGIASVTRLYPTGTQKVTTPKKKLNLTASFADTSLLTMFGFKLSAGDVKHALHLPNSVVLTENAAQKIFGAADAMNQLISFDKYGDFVVTGILKDSLGKSHIDYECYLSMTTVPVLEKEGLIAQAFDEWNSWSSGYTYILLKRGFKITDLKSSAKKVADEVKSLSKLEGKEDIKFDVQSFDEIILGEELSNSIGNVGSRGKMAAELLIGFVILLSACFNYTNLSIARSLKRGREVGIRKVAGARRGQVFMQFIIESLMNAVLAFALSLIMLNLMIEYAPYLAGGVSKTFIADDPGVLVWLTVFISFTALLAGSLPAWVLSSFKPVEILKNLYQVKVFGSFGLRKALIVAQFALALIITIFAAVFNRQFEYMAKANPGYLRENMLVIDLNGTKVDYLRNRVSSIHGVQQSSALAKSLGRGPSGTSTMRLDLSKEPFRIPHFDVDSNFVTVYGLRLLAGQSFRKLESIDHEDEVLVNKQLIDLLGFNSPQEAIGRQVQLDDSINVNIAGVLKDFHFYGMESGIPPLLLRNRANEFAFLQIKTQHKSQAFESAINAAWKSVHPGEPLHIYWLKDRLYEQQSAGDTVSTLNFLAFMAIAIATLGLLGMVVYITKTREKEIGIRKVLGASIASVMLLLSRGFLKLVLLAGAIAIPLGYIGSYMFVSMFVTRITPGPEIILLSFAGILLITLLTISTQVFKAAAANPVDSLKNE
ncbi:MAG: FtsX-like permease family protein [Chitinophagaceae bacterium]|nr:MAG: FtsX-like permease family protein [Chitinophagaceae bacterium]